MGFCVLKWRCGFAVPRQQRFVAFDAIGLRQAFEDVTQVGVRLLVVGLGGFDQAVDLRAGSGALGCVAEQPVLSADDEGPDGSVG